MPIILIYVFLGVFGGGMSYMMGIVMISGWGQNGWPNLINCMFMGALAGFVPGILRQIMGRPVPILQSWLSLCILILLISYVEEFTYRALIYGYISHLLWEDYKNMLPKIYN